MKKKEAQPTLPAMLPHEGEGLTLQTERKLISISKALGRLQVHEFGKLAEHLQANNPTLLAFLGQAFVRNGSSRDTRHEGALQDHRDRLEELENRP